MTAAAHAAHLTTADLRTTGGIGVVSVVRQQRWLAKAAATPSPLGALSLASQLQHSSKRIAKRRTHEQRAQLEAAQSAQPLAAPPPLLPRLLSLTAALSRKPRGWSISRRTPSAALPLQPPPLLLLRSRVLSSLSAREAERRSERSSETRNGRMTARGRRTQKRRRMRRRTAAAL